MSHWLTWRRRDLKPMQSCFLIFKLLLINLTTIIWRNVYLRSYFHLVIWSCRNLVVDLFWWLSAVWVTVTGGPQEWLKPCLSSPVHRCPNSAPCSSPLRVKPSAAWSTTTAHPSRSRVAKSVLPSSEAPSPPVALWCPSPSLPPPFSQSYLWMQWATKHTYLSPSLFWQVNFLWPSCFRCWGPV